MFVIGGIITCVLNLGGIYIVSAESLLNISIYV